MAERMGWSSGGDGGGGGSGKITLVASGGGGGSSNEGQKSWGKDVYYGYSVSSSKEGETIYPERDPRKERVVLDNKLFNATEYKQGETYLLVLRKKNCRPYDARDISFSSIEDVKNAYAALGEVLKVYNRGDVTEPERDRFADLDIGGEE